MMLPIKALIAQLHVRSTELDALKAAIAKTVHLKAAFTEFDLSARESREVAPDSGCIFS